MVEDQSAQSKLKLILQETTKIENRMKRIKHKIMVMSGKGGVGKTTVAVNLAVAIANKGFKVGILDADIHGPNVPKMLGINEEKLFGDENGIHPISINSNLFAVSIGLLLPDLDAPIIWRGSLKHKAIQQFLADVEWGDLDYLIIDLPPGTGDEPLSVVQLIKNVDGVVIVITPQEVALQDAKKAINFARQVNTRILGIVENMSGEIFGSGGGEKAAREMEIPFLGRLSMNRKIVESSDTGKPFVNQGNSETYIHEFEAIVSSILKQTEK